MYTFNKDLGNKNKDENDKTIKREFYNTTGNLGQFGPKYSFPKQKKLKLGHSEAINQLSPFTYDYSENADKIYYKRPAYAFGKDARDPKLKNADFPGPGKYDYSTSKGKSYSFTKDKRKWKVQTVSPGPGSYKIPYSLFDFPNFVSANGFNSKYRFI